MCGAAAITQLLQFHVGSQVQEISGNVRNYLSRARNAVGVWPRCRLNVLVKVERFRKPAVRAISVSERSVHCNAEAWPLYIVILGSVLSLGWTVMLVWVVLDLVGLT
jgi:hypothetical protein